MWRYYYYAGAARIAMRVKDPTHEQVYYLFADHLGSTNITSDPAGNQVSLSLYTAWGEARLSAGSSLTDYGFTGQRKDDGIGLYFYNARWYDSYLNRWNQPDTIIPGQYDPLNWDRYSYVGNNPVNHTDPTGHAACDEEGNCYNNQGWYRAPDAPRLNATDTWKMTIQGKFGIKMSDGGDKNWDNANLQLMFRSLSTINNAVNGKLSSMGVGASFVLKNQVPLGDYHGCTMCTSGTAIEFFTKGTAVIRQMNIFHEVGHLLDNVPGFKNVFTNAVNQENKPSWVSSDKKINPDALVDLLIYNDPNYPYVEARQTYDRFGASEQWADAFGNYVAGNIKLSNASGPGVDMYNFVSGALAGIP